MKKLFLTICLALAGLACSGSVNAAGIEITPHIIDEKAKAKEIFEYTVTLTNTTEQKATLYVLVYDLAEKDGRQEYLNASELDRTRSIASWTEIKRGALEIDPGQSLEIPLAIKVSMYALPGKYHASIVFSQGSNRDQARENMLEMKMPEILINIDVEDISIVKAGVQKIEYKPVYLQKPVSFSFEMDNTGNKTLRPGGSIFIYDRRGAEVAELDFNEEGKAIQAGKTESFTTAWKNIKGFGKYKARVEAEYGDGKTINDTFYFWYLPLPLLLGILVAIFVIIFLFAYYIHKKTYLNYHHIHHHQAHSPVLDLKKKGK